MSLKCAAVAAVVLLGIFSSCKPHAVAPSDGESLAQTYCMMCHVFPDPSLLDKKSWGPVIDDMGARLGRYTAASRDSVIGRLEWANIDPALIYPEQAVISEEQLQKIRAYYLEKSPDVLSPYVRESTIQVGIPGFDVKNATLRYNMPLTTLADLDETNRTFYLGNYTPGNSSMVILDRFGELRSHWKLYGPPVAAGFDGGRLLILVIGTGPEPTEAVRGSIMVVDRPDGPVQTLISDLKRPVDMELGDLNGDGRTDIVVAEYGNQVGFLSWYEQLPDGGYERHVLSRRPGTVTVIVRDLDEDGRLDVAALTAQGDEGIDIYHNDGGERFSPRRVLRFPSLYGSNHFEMVDINQDGILDIVYTNGDNADITPIVKSYHGLRIFLGARDGSFKEQQFVPLNGAYAARAVDFDQDGDLDIAAISYFPDYRRYPEESFIYLQNQGDLTFKPFTFERSFRGRWIVMDAGDLDGDSDVDLLLGSNIGFAPQGDLSDLMERWTKEAPTYLILENKLY